VTRCGPWAPDSASGASTSSGHPGLSESVTESVTARENVRLLIFVCIQLSFTILG